MPSTSDSREALVLLLLKGLEQRNLTPMREYEFHQLVRRLQPTTGSAFRFLDEPISYSYDLQSYLKTLEQAHYLDEFILVRNGWVPRFEYELSALGRAQAEEKRERLRLDDPHTLATMDNELDRFAGSFRPQEPISPRWGSRQYRKTP